MDKISFPQQSITIKNCMQLFYNLSEPAMEDALHEIESMRQFAGLSLSGPIPDETTILKCIRPKKATSGMLAESCRWALMTRWD